MTGATSGGGTFSSGVRVARFLVFYIVFCRCFFFVLLTFFFMPLCCLLFFYLWILITLLVSSKSSLSNRLDIFCPNILALLSFVTYVSLVSGVICKFCELQYIKLGKSYFPSIILCFLL